MKKIFSILAIAATLLATACSQSEELVSVKSNDTTVTITAQLPQIGSRAEFSDGLTATALTYAVYENNSTTPLFSNDELVFSNREAVVEMKLVTGKTYDILFWAQSPNATSYDVLLDGQTLTVDYTTMSANDENNDAFYYFLEDLKVEGAVNKDITLYRPFAQINLGTDDYDKAKKAGLIVGKTSMVATAVYNTLNLANGEVSGDAPISIAAGDAIDTTVEEYPVAPYQYLEMNYVLVGKDKSLTDCTFTIIDDKGTTVNTFTVANVPVQRNYRTNIYGSLLTDPAKFAVTIDPIYKTPDYNNKYVKVLTVYDVPAAIAAGAKSVEVEQAPNTDSNVEFPAVPVGEESTDVAVSIPATAYKVTFSYETATPETGKANLTNINITASSVDNVEINLPESHVTLNGAAYNNVAASVSSTTLIIPEGTAVANLEMTGGNVEIYGDVETITLAKGCAVKVYAVQSAAELDKAVACKAAKILIGDAATLRAFATLANTKNGSMFSNTTVALSADIDLDGENENWVSANCAGASKFTFDGQGYTIRNMSAINNVAYGNGFFSNIVGSNVKNVTFENAYVSRYGSNKISGNVYGIVTGYTYGTVTFENVHVKNSAVWGFGKVAPIIGMAADPGTSVTTLKNCTVTDTTVAGGYNCAGLMGLSQNVVVIENCEVTGYKWLRPGNYTYVELDTTMLADTSIEVKGTYWKYNDEWYYTAWSKYYNEYIGSRDDRIAAPEGAAVDGYCHN